MTLINVTPIMTSNTTPSPYIVKSSSYWGSGYEAYRAFNNIEDTEGWCTSAGTFENEWIQLDFGVETKVSMVTLKTAGRNEKMLPSEFLLQGSHDGIVFEDIKVIRTGGNWTPQETREFDLGVIYEYRIFRIYITECDKNTFPYYTGVEEIKFKYDDSYKPAKKKLSIHKTLKSNLKQTVDAGTKELHLTEDGGFYTYDKDGNLVQIGHDHENKEILDKLTLGTNGELLFDGKTIDVDVDLTDYMKISEYASAINQGSVAKADKALEIDGVKQAQPLMYYGTDNNGNVGFHYIPIDKSDKNGGIEQRVILNAKTNEVYTVDSATDLSDGKAIVQAYKFVQGEQNVIRTIKEFNNSNSENFYYDKTNISFDDGAEIITRHNLDSTSVNDYYKTDEINKSEFINIECVEKDRTSGEHRLSNEHKSTYMDVSDDGLSCTKNSSSGVYVGVRSGFPITGKKYFEVTFLNNNTDTFGCGFCTEKAVLQTVSSISNMKNVFYHMWKQGRLYINGSNKKYVTVYGANNTMGYAIDCDSRSVKIYVNGTYLSEYVYTDSDFVGSIYPVIFLTSVASATINFGASKFKIEESNQQGWDELKSQGYEPCDSDYNLIFENGTYYTIENNNLVQINEQITREVIKNRGCSIGDISDNISLLNNSFNVIKIDNGTVSVLGLKSKSELIVANNDFYVNISDNIDYFESISNVSGYGDIKIVFSIDGGNVWKTYENGIFSDLSCVIPDKEFNTLTQDELVQWNQSKSEIQNLGINYSELKNIDFNNLSFDKIRFAYVVSVESVNDVCVNKSLVWQFDSKGSMKKMKDTEYDIKVHSQSIEFKSLIDTDMVKVNILPDCISSGSNAEIEFATDLDIENLFS